LVIDWKTWVMSESKGLVLVVEDEKPIADILRIYLTRDGFGVHVESDGIAGLSAAKTLHPVAIILDVGLPGMDGVEVCKELRNSGVWTPILFCTARDDEVDRILGLEMGGDDYITKPFSPREIVARVKSVLRRTNLVQSGAGPIVVGEVSLDSDSRRVLLAGEEISLTATEFDLMEYLMSQPGRVFSRDQLLSHVWGYSSIVGTRTVDVHIAQLRSKFGEHDPIRTVRGVGYSIEVS
jgi:DNA-binding response OmpR family regulator